MNSTVLIIVIIVVVVILVVIAAAVYLTRGRRRSERLKERFGPEYERTVAEAGDRRTAEEQLAAREKRHRTLNLRTLDDDERTHFHDRWLCVQSDFVDDPDRAVDRADALVAELMTARGYPAADFERRSEDISVEHPVVVERYREAQRISAAHARGRVDTEELRRAVTSYKSLVQALLDEDSGGSHGGQTQPNTKETRP